MIKEVTVTKLDGHSLSLKWKLPYYDTPETVNGRTFLQITQTNLEGIYEGVIGTLEVVGSYWVFFPSTKGN